MTLDFDAGVPGRVDAAFTLPTGRTLALIGPNGAGKSSTIALIAGLLQPERGSIRLGGRVLSSAQPSRAVPPHQRRIAMLGQDPLLFPHLTARANIAFPLRARGRTRRAADTEARSWLERLALTELGDRRPDQLSGGQA
ncbi:MAG: ATP-binding cassette domain-containing protein, partial [Nocardioides sp.]